MAGATTQADRQAQVLAAGYNGPLTDAAINQAYANAATPSDLAQSGISNKPSGGGGGGGANPSTNSSTAVQQAANRADQQLASLMQALSATNEQDFNQRVSEFNQNHALALQQFGLQQQAQQFYQQIQSAGLTGMFNGQPTFAAQVQAAGLTGMFGGQPTLAAQLQQANLSGMYNGQPTEAAREFNTNLAEKQQEFGVNTATSLADLSSKLTGPADYFQFLNATNQGKNILGSLQSGQPRASFGGFSGQPQPLTLSSIMGRLGIGTGFNATPGGTPGSDSGTQQQTPQAGTSAQSGGIQLPNNMGQIPFPHQVNPAVWDSWGQAGQEFIKGAAAAAGFDPTEYERQINATRPGTIAASPSSSGAFSSGGESAY